MQASQVSKIIYDAISPFDASVVRVIPQSSGTFGTAPPATVAFEHIDFSRLNDEQRRQLRRYDIAEDRVTTFQSNNEFLHIVKANKPRWLIGILYKSGFPGGGDVYQIHEIASPSGDGMGRFRIPESVVSYDIVLTKSKMKNIEDAVFLMERTINEQHIRHEEYRVKPLGIRKSFERQIEALRDQHLQGVQCPKEQVDAALECEKKAMQELQESNQREMEHMQQSYSQQIQHIQGEYEKTVGELDEQILKQSERIKVDHEQIRILNQTWGEVFGRNGLGFHSIDDVDVMMRNSLKYQQILNEKQCVATQYTEQILNEKECIVMGISIVCTAFIMLFIFWLVMRRKQKAMTTEMGQALKTLRERMMKDNDPLPVIPSVHANRLGVNQHPAVRDQFGMKEPYDVTPGEGFHVKRITEEGTTKTQTPKETPDEGEDEGMNADDI